MDGLASALIARRGYPNATMKSVQYGEELENRWFFDYDRVILLDFSYNEEIMNEFKNYTNFIWIDHHKTARELTLWNKKSVKGKRNTRKAACELTWDYFNPGRECPFAIKLVADRDLWKFKYGDDTRKLQCYFETLDINNEIDIELIDDILLDGKKCNDVSEFIQAGEYILDYKDAQVKRIYETGYVTKAFGHKAFNCVTPILVNEVADYAFKQDKEIEIAVIELYEAKDDKVRCNIELRSRGNVDVSEIAKQNSGGGHHNAAGFIHKEELNIFEKIKKYFFNR
jgi:oligoribonuclease NrnB/cAMP/cGMP phosphodiesterase (DHH superfamily)